MRVTKTEALARVEDIRVIQGDDELAHSKEDQLRRDILEAIVNNPSLTKGAIRELARIALSTEALDFERWCA